MMNMFPSWTRNNTATSSSSQQLQQQEQTKGRLLLNKVLPDFTTVSTVRDNYAFFARCSCVGMFFGLLLGAGTPASPIFYRTFQSDAAAQFNIIFTFTTIGFLSSSIPYGLFMDNAPSREKLIAQYRKQQKQKQNQLAKQLQENKKTEASSTTNMETSNNIDDITGIFNEKLIVKAQRTWAPQLQSVWQPLWIGTLCWLTGHMYYPGRFVLEFEDKKVRIREFLRITSKTMLALHRIHVPFILGWSVFFGFMIKPLRKSHDVEHYFSDEMKEKMAKREEEKAAVVEEFVHKKE